MTITSPAPTGFPVSDRPGDETQASAPTGTGRWRRVIAGGPEAPETVEKYHTQHLVYTIPLVLFGIFRYLYLMYQQAGERNPTEAILGDPPFLINMVLWGLAVVLIIYYHG